MKGKIVLVPFPFTSLKGTKLRPALVLFEDRNDVTLTFISSRVEHYNSKTDVLIEQAHRDILIGELGEIGPLLKKEINQKICSLLGFES